MSDLKKDRLKMLKDCMNNLSQVSELYQQGLPAWILIQNAWGHIKSVYYLESETTIEDETIGVKFK